MSGYARLCRLSQVRLGYVMLGYVRTGIFMLNYVMPVLIRIVQVR
jgi:hypothetical protein